jgi:hypothetical protein
MGQPQVVEKDLNVAAAQSPHQNEDKKVDTKTVPDVEFDIQEEATTPVLYSKRSISFMVLFSGLAIGSDAYNSALMGQLSLLLTVLYPDTLDVGMSSQLTNSFIVGLVSLHNGILL